MSKKPQDNDLELASGGANLGSALSTAGKALKVGGQVLGPVGDAAGVYFTVKEGKQLQEDTQGNKDDTNFYDGLTKKVQDEMAIIKEATAKLKE